MQKRILFIDEHGDDFGRVVAALLGDHYDVKAAGSLADAVHLLRESSFDLIFTEALEQGVSVYCLDQTFLRKLKGAARLTPVVLCSIHPGAAWAKADVLGIAAVLHKPFTPMQLERTVEEVLDRAGRGDGERFRSAACGGGGMGRRQRIGRSQHRGRYVRLQAA